LGGSINDAIAIVISEVK